MHLLAIDTLQNVTAWYGDSLLSFAVQLAEIIGAIGLVVYVIYSYKSFREIKKQTDSMLNAHLLVEDKIISGLYELEQKKIKFSTAYIQNKISDEWVKFLQQPFSALGEDVLHGNYIALIFTNYGKTAVNKISFSGTLTVFHDEIVAEALNQVPTTDYPVTFTINELIRPDRMLAIVLLPTAPFPKFEITLRGKYYDIYNKEYQLERVFIKDENMHLLELPAVDGEGDGVPF